MHSISVLAVIKVLLTLFTVFTIVNAIYTERSNMKFVLTIWSRFRFKMLLEVFGVIFQTILIAASLAMSCSLFRHGWMYLVFHEDGNMLMSPVISMESSGFSLVRLMPFLFLVFLIIAMPFMARIEEEIFRKGYCDWTEITKQSIKFGLVHCLAGVPLSCGIALIGTGFFYAYKYRKELKKRIERNEDWFQAEKEAVLVSTTYHTLYNSTLVIILAVLLTVC